MPRTGLALIAAAEDRRRVSEALVGTELRFVSSMTEVLAALRAESERIRFVILEARDATGRPTAGLARQVTQLFPALPVIGYCDTSAEHSQEILALATAGVHELMFKKRDDCRGVIAGVLRSAAQGCAGEVVLQRLDFVPPALRAFVEQCLANPGESHSVGSVARALGLHRKTLVNQCRREGYPPPGTIVAWCLLLLAAALLVTPGLTVEHVAQQLEFPSASALRNMLKRYTGLQPMRLRESDALERLCARFQALGTARARRD